MASVQQVDVKLVDAVAVHDQHPETFHVPSRVDIDRALERRRYVKVCNGSERFWVKPTRTEATKQYGRVANVLITPGLSRGDEICFSWRNVYDIES